MELIEYIKIIRRYRILALQIIGVVLVIALGASFIRTQQQEATFSLIIRPRVIEKTEGFQFTDLLEASDRVTRMTENWLREQNLGITTKRLGSQFITISFSAQDEAFAKERVDGINKETNEFLSSLSPSGGLGSFEAITSDFVFGTKNPYWLFSISMGIILGLFFALSGVLGKHYFAAK